VLIAEAWDCEPEAVIAPVTTCVVCGDYCTGDDLLGSVEWWEQGDPWRGVGQTPILAYHTGRCADAIQKAAYADDGTLLDAHVDQELGWLVRNVETPPRPGADGLLRCQRKPLDLTRTQQLLETVRSPLIRKDTP
jgi:hypothetical protein